MRIGVKDRARSHPGGTTQECLEHRHQDLQLATTH